MLQDFASPIIRHFLATSNRCINNKLQREQQDPDSGEAGADQKNVRLIIRNDPVWLTTIQYRQTIRP